MHFLALNGQTILRNVHAIVNAGSQAYCVPLDWRMLAKRLLFRLMAANFVVGIYKLPGTLLQGKRHLEASKENGLRQ